MPDLISDKKVFSLSEVTQSIQRTLNKRYQSSFWVMAEMNKLNHYVKTGHCYPELVEKSGSKIIAQIRSVLWKEDYRRINELFLHVLKEPLKDGIKILIHAQINFDNMHGLSLHILDIDPSYSLGDLEREKQETIHKLREENIFRQNKTISLPLLPQRIAVISVESSKGYADFIDVLHGNQWHYCFFHVLFPSLLQGEKAVGDILRQLKRIERLKHHFDVVTIIRGGGGDIGLSCYNNYELAKRIALFPLPVFTGIGHSTNETVAEMVSYDNAITPTKLAEDFIQRFHNVAVPVKKAQETITDKSLRLLNDENVRFEAALKSLKNLSLNTISGNYQKLQSLSLSLSMQSQHILQLKKTVLSNHLYAIHKTIPAFNSAQKKELHNLISALKKDSHALLRQKDFLLIRYIETQFQSVKQQILKKNTKLNALAEKHEYLNKQVILKQKNEIINLEKTLQNLHPENVLKRGYSIMTLNGKAIKSIKGIKTGTTLKTQVYDGSITSVVTSTENNSSI